MEIKEKTNKAEKFWDRMANQFDNRSWHFEQPPVEETKQYLKISDIVLDYGCATGTVTLEIAGNVKVIQGIDISSKMIELAKGKASKRKIENVDFIQSTIFDERYNREHYDVILAFNILHFFKNTKTELQRINELLRPGGLMIIATACMGEKTFLNMLQFLLFSPLIASGIIPYMKFFKFAELEDSIVNENFQIVEIESLNGSGTNYFIVAKKK